MKYSLATQSLLGIFTLTTPMMSTTATTTGSSASQNCLAPETKQFYPVLKNEKVSSDSHILTIGLPENRALLGWEENIPTCISVAANNESLVVAKAKSYSPISHPNLKGEFQLLVKAYPPQEDGKMGVGAYICGLQEGDVMEAKVKKPRQMHSSPHVLGRWKHVGLVAGGTGIAPLYQILVLLMSAQELNCKIHILSINRKQEDILLKSQLDQFAKEHPDVVSVTYSLTGNEDDENSPQFLMGRGTVQLAKQALPDPSLDDVMILVCGKNGFVEHWAGKVGRGPPKPDGSKGPKIQGPLLGVLNDAGYSASQVFKY